jgi:hypothetical protein
MQFQYIMLYIADLNRDGLIKIGVANWRRLKRRESELRRELEAPKLTMVVKTPIPFGWGRDEDWEGRIIHALSSYSGNLQLYANSEQNTEVVDATIVAARRELQHLRAETEIDIMKDAHEISTEKEDWRFFEFMLWKYPETEFSVKNNSGLHWRDLITRQVFINWLRGDEWASMPPGYID